MTRADGERTVEGVRRKILGYWAADQASPDPPPQFDGGSEEDRRALLALNRAFMEANDALDEEKLRRTWSRDPSCVFFNSNGHTYHGLDDWLTVWTHYRPRIRALHPHKTGTIRIVVRGDMALLTSDRFARYFDWISTEPVPPLFEWPYVRHTQVAVREGREWRIIHAHFSMAAPGMRPDLAGA
jgi:hypothetical protein